ncbi:protein-L-isoaspartate O-methyltransferase, partial [Patescibacteria group bacterium AH-259-L07]|nr:protein-L-isoaspartate O-methyltransferase [Patescibacteria group bacterium AH-259-L07]
MDIFLLLASLFIFVLILFVGVVIILPLIRGAPFLPTHRTTVEAMIKLADIQPGQKAADIGSGEGRIVIALARVGAEAHGYEINPLLVWWSRYKIRKAGLENSAFIHWRSFWWKNFSDYNVITVFGISYIMKGLEKKFKKELHPH